MKVFLLSLGILILNIFYTDALNNVLDNLENNNSQKLNQIRVYKCPIKSEVSGDNHTVLTGENITVPSYLYNTNLILKIRPEEFPGCGPGLELVDVELTYISHPESVPPPLANMSLQTDHTSGMAELFSWNTMSPEGVLSVENFAYTPTDYCISEYYRDMILNQPVHYNESNITDLEHNSTHNQTESGSPLVLKYCRVDPNYCSKSLEISSKSSDPPRRPCIKKCCPLGMSVDLSSTPICLPSGSNVWKGFFYDKTSWEKVSPKGNNSNSELQPHYWHYLLSEAGCNPNHTVELYGRKLRNVPEEPAKLLSDGRVMVISGRRWAPLEPKVRFCIDGIQNFREEDATEFYSGREEDRILIICSEDNVLKSMTQSSIYMYCLFGASVFYILTALVHLLLYDKQNTNGWSVFCLTLSLFFMSVCMANAHRLGLDGAAEIRYSHVCVANAILAHFFMLSSFTWLTLINFNIWSAFRTLKPRCKKSLKDFYYYLVIGFGGPLTVVIVGLTLQQVYPKDDSLVLVPEYGQNICFVAEWAQGVYIYYILAFLFIIIIILFTMTSVKLYMFQQDTVKVRSLSTAGDRQMVRLYAKLSVVLGISWIFEFISWAVTKDHQAWYWMIFDLYNLLTSVFIFVIFVCKLTTLEQLGQKYWFIKPVTTQISTLLSCSIKEKSEQSGTTGSSNMQTAVGPGGIKMEVQNSSVESGLNKISKNKIG